MSGSRKRSTAHDNKQSFVHHGSVTLVDVACLVTWRSGAQSLVIVVRLLLWWTAGLESSAEKTLGGPGSWLEQVCGSARVKRSRSICLKLIHGNP